MKRLRIYYYLLWIATLLWMLGQELNVFPQAFISSTPALDYTLNLLCIITGIGGTFLSCRLFAFHRVRKELGTDDAHAAEQANLKWNKVRLGLLALSILPNVFIYYASTFSPTALYCTLIALTGSIFCRPTPLQ